MLRDTYLVQTLEQPAETEFEYKLSRVFGGGMLQINDEAWKLLRPICRFHSMGAAEFEFGAIPACLGALAEDITKLVCSSYLIPAKHVLPNYETVHKIEMLRRDHNRNNRLLREKGEKTKRFKPPKPEGVTDKRVYIICRLKDLKEVEQRILKLAQNKIFLKRSCFFPTALSPVSEWDKEKVGWLELDNGFLFFTDKVMWQRFVDLFRQFLPEDHPGRLMENTDGGDSDDPIQSDPVQP